jgi:transcriptional regulator with XRE-family HTH domain
MAMDLKKFIGLRIKLARKQKGWTQAQLADRLDKAVETISHIERGATYTSLQTLDLIAKSLGKPLVYFFERAEKARTLRASQAEAQQKAMALIANFSEHQLHPIIAMLEATAKQSSQRNAGGSK